MNLVTRLDVPERITLEQYRKLPVGSEVIIWSTAPLEFLDKEVMFTIARERQYKLRSVPRHWTREMMK
jgi:hypothetical protein